MTDGGRRRGSTLWHGRFAGGPADALIAYTVSLPFDRRLWPDDIAGSRAHVGGLRRAGLLTDDERDAVLAALDRSRDELADGHVRVRRRATRTSTPRSSGGSPSSPARPAPSCTPARSRNDQVATDLRLWCKRELVEVARAASSPSQDVLLVARRGRRRRLPARLHAPAAGPAGAAGPPPAGPRLGAGPRRRPAAGHRRAPRRLAARGRGARRHVAADRPRVRPPPRSGSRDVFDNSLDAVSDRDFVAEALFDLALIGIHLSRLGEEWVLWTSEEFGFARLDDAYATGSSMMPQKKNADIAELARGKSGRLIGNLTGLLATLKGLPLAYNRDLQEDKEPLFDSVDQISLALVRARRDDRHGDVRARADGRRRPTPRRRRPPTSPSGSSSAGTPFREAHAIVGALVRRHLAGGDALRELVAADDRSAPMPRRSWRPVSACAAAPRRVALARSRSPPSSTRYRGRCAASARPARR